MIKNLLNLITSGVLLRPKNLIGIILGSILKYKLDIRAFFEFYQDYRLYVFFLIASAVYIFSFQRLYKENNRDIDYLRMLMISILSGLQIVAVSFLTGMFFLVFRFMFF